ncbi:MAG: DUF4493 domain-containing protein [Bacteroidales bacterium]|nr:DUF4493 domain-containing protein [Bacteroidales bacterium]
MKKLLVFASMMMLVLVGCKKVGNTNNQGEGFLSFADFSLQYDAETKAAEAAPGNYVIIIKDVDGKVVKTTTYTNVKNDGNKITLIAGQYTLEARSSSDEVPASAFERPIYGASADFEIAAGETTSIGTLTCTLLQCKVTVSYDDAFLGMVTGAGQAVVTIDPTAPLTFDLNYTNNTPSYDESAGYFAVNNGENTTMTVVFSGKIDGKSQKMTSVITNIQPRQWRQIKFTKKIDAQGNATIALVINGYIEDEELPVEVKVLAEDVIGEDPDAPKGDGGITLEFHPECTMYSDLLNIVVPKVEDGPMDLRLIATVPAGVKKFIVNIESTSPGFLAAVDAAGGSQINLVNPSPESEIIFQVVPFTHGSGLLGMTEIGFDLSNAQTAIIGFVGVHTFYMEITDANDCRKQIPVKLIVE